MKIEKQNIKAIVSWDSLGILTSLACGVHCALLPIFFSTFPLLGINIIHNVYFEWIMILIACVIGLISLLNARKKHVGGSLPVVLFLSGFVFLTCKMFFDHAAEVGLLLLAIICIVLAHGINILYFAGISLSGKKIIKDVPVNEFKR